MYYLKFLMSILTEYHAMTLYSDGTLNRHDGILIYNNSNIHYQCKTEQTAMSTAIKLHIILTQV